MDSYQLKYGSACSLDKPEDWGETYFDNISNKYYEVIACNYQDNPAVEGYSRWTWIITSCEEECPGGYDKVLNEDGELVCPPCEHGYGKVPHPETEELVCLEDYLPYCPYAPQTNPYNPQTGESFCTCKPDSSASPVLGTSYNTKTGETYNLFECIRDGSDDNNGTDSGGGDDSNSTDSGGGDDSNSTDSGGGDDSNSTDSGGGDSGGGDDSNGTDIGGIDSGDDDSNGTDSSGEDSNGTDRDENSTDNLIDEEGLNEESNKFNLEASSLIKDFITDKLDTYIDLHHVDVPNFVGNCQCEEYTIDVTVPHFGSINKTSSICPSLRELFKDTAVLFQLLAYFMGLIAFIKIVGV